MSETTAERTFGTPAIPAPAAGPDPDVTDVDSPSIDDELAALAAELNTEVAGTKRLEVEGRPGQWEVEYDLGFDGRVIDSARKRAKDASFADGVDGVKFGAILLGRTCVAIYRGGKRLELGGDVTTFQSRELWGLVKAHGVVECVRKVYGLDGRVDATARKLMVDAGWGGDAVEADPTE